MGWGRIDDGFDDHPKVVALLDGDDQVMAGLAVGLWTLCLTWAHRNTRKKGKTPGLLPAGLPRRFFGPVGKAGAELLVQYGLWEPQEDGGWMIHDFGDYLPTDETRAARSEAGKRGAEKRWAQKRAAEQETQDPAMANSHSADGTLPSACHDADSNAVASDGSRTPARRDPIPTPIPIPGFASDEAKPPPVGDDPASPRRTRKTPTSTSAADTAGANLVVAAYIDGAKDGHGEAPSGDLPARVGREAKKLLSQGKPLDQLIAAARDMGAAGYVSLAHQLQLQSARRARDRPGHDGRRVSTAEELAGWNAYAERDAS